MESLSRNLFALRKQRKLSREAVARALEMSAMTYQRYEKNLRDPTAPVLVKLAQFYGVTLDQLVGRAPLPLEEEHQ
jgi:transcriptional regulator with XRE-family HTH domain|nr:helix-turn-helix transcriptional regulator [uncultured Oscillibacter sp.]